MSKPERIDWYLLIFYQENFYIIRKPDYKAEDNNTITEKSLNAHDKPIFRQHNAKSKRTKGEKPPKWPKSSQNHKRKPATRMTKMQMMQQEDTTKISKEQMEEEDHMIGQLSPYSIKQQLQQIVKTLPNANVTIDVIGRTVEYNDIVLLKITEDNTTSDKYFRANDGKYAEDLPEKKIIFIVHGLSVMGYNYLSCLSYGPHFTKLLSYYIAHLDKFDIFLIPMANPDGVAVTRNNVIYWNKNVSPQDHCPGVSLDHNFDIAWNNNNSVNSCHQKYPGPAPFSEAETRAVRDVFHKYNHKIVAYLNVHAGSYSSTTFKGDAVLYPNGYTDSVSDDDKYIDLKGEIDEVMRNASFQVMSVTVDTLHSWYGKISGSSVDYASTVYGIPFALELVMQLYEDTSSEWKNQDGQDTNYEESALDEIWGRVIYVTFNYIWKTLNGNEVQ
ncbi:unnamed protein product [Euphydryas editha]|uniref:Peptidase M14 domain-containing protein n=1 Tax=Euphydryas editha TaxID=104508 RepID=A0AAU9TV74_EUPED|nr:unnamed protein product [Euphydryas editha]